MAEVRDVDRLRVLVVDDHSDLAELLADVVVRIGHECQIAPTGAEALVRAAVFEPHLVLLDIGLPDMSGYAVSTELRARGVRAYIAAVTGWGRDDDRSRSFAAGIDEHVTKPTTIEKIHRVLDAATTRHRHRDGRPGPTE